MYLVYFPLGFEGRMYLTYAMDCLLNSITGMNVAFLLTVSPPYTQLPLAKRNAYFPFIQDSFYQFPFQNNLFAIHAHPPVW